MQEQIRQFIVETATYGGSAAAVAYFIFRFLGKRWIENKFEQSLENHRHQQALELQKFRLEVDSMLSGTLKVQEKEFETLPEAWNKLDEAYSQALHFLSPIQQYPNLDQLNPVQMEEFFKDSELLESQKQDIRDAREKVKKYQEIIFWHRLRTAEKKCSDFHNCVMRHSIFFPLEIKDRLTTIAEKLWDAISTKKVGYEAKDYKMQNDGWRKIKEDIEPLYKTIHTDIHTRLHSHGHKL